MSSKHRRSRRRSSRRSHLRLEAMEPRLLLTSMELFYPGDRSVFLYRKGDSGSAFGGDIVRVELRNDVTGVGRIELIGVNPQTGVFDDIPGILDWVDFRGGLAGGPPDQVVGVAPYTQQDEILAIAIDSNGNAFGFSNTVNVDNDPNLTFPPNSPAWGGTPPSPAPPDPYAAYNAAFLVSLNLATGTAARLGVVQSDYTGDILPVPDVANGPFSDEQLVYNNITAADFDEFDNLWAIGSIVDKLPPNPQATPAQQYLPDAPTANNVPINFIFRVDTTSQAGPGGGPNEVWVMERHALSDQQAQITTIAWYAPGNYFYAVDARDNHLKIIMTDGTIADVGALTIAGSSPPQAVTGITGLDFDETYTLYGVNNTNLYEIDRTDGDCVATGNLGLTTISSLAYDQNNPAWLWGVDTVQGGADRLVRISKYPPKPMDPYAIYVAESDQYTEIVMSVVVPYLDNNVWRYDDVKMWNAPTTPYIGTYNNTDYFAPANSGGVLVGAIPWPSQALPYRFKPVWEEYDGYNVAQPIGFWPGSATAGPLYAGINVAPGPATHTRGEHTGDLGYVFVGGTLAGRLSVPRSLEIAQVGFLYGSIDVGGDLRTVYIQTDAGRVNAGNTWFPYWDDIMDMDMEYANNVIHAGGTITDINVRGTLYSTVVADGYANIPPPGDSFVNWNNHTYEPILEHEGRLPEVRGSRTGFWWPFRAQSDYEDLTDPLDDPNELDSHMFNVILSISGNRTVTNNTLETAQYLASESGNIILWGYLDDQPDEVFDYYALPLLAGQTVRIHGCTGVGEGERNPGIGIPGYGHVTDPREGYHPFLYMPTWNHLNLQLLSPDNELVGTYGYETVEDQGIGSRGEVDEDLVFTAPEAGVYYIRIGDPLPPNNGGSDYALFITGATPSTIGGIRVNADYQPSFNPYPAGPVEGPEGYALYATNGNIGAVNVTDRARGLSVDVERGSFVALEAGRLGHTGTGLSPAIVVARDDIGRIQSRTGSVVGYFAAGFNTGNVRNNNASLQNVSSAGNTGMADGLVAMYTDFIASGSIGWVQVAGTVSGACVFRANSDQTGPAGSIDLVEVGGNWGDLTGGRPSLYHGPDGNVRFVRVAGTMFEDYSGWIGPLEPTVLQGTSSVFADDGGATVTINALAQSTTNPDGSVTQDITTVRYWILDVDDAVGGVMARLETDGATTFTMSKAQKLTSTLEISDFFLNGTQATDAITISGAKNTTGTPSAFDVYYLHGSAIASFTNQTAGDIVSGNLQGVTNLVTGGSIGYTENSTRAWVPGADARPAVDPAAFGWFSSRMNGVQIVGDVALVQAGGSVGDLLVSGTVTSIVVNADRVTPAGGWDGVRGTVYAGTRIGSINVGDGSKDDGSSAVAQAAIFSGGTIGTVSISRRYEFLNGQYMGLIDGAIMAMGDIENVVGTNGARLTAIIACMPFSAFRAWGTAQPTLGGVGTVSFSGPGAAIYDAEIAAEYVGTVRTSLESLGIWGSYISGDRGRPSQPTIGLVEAGGPGLRTTHIGATGGSIGTVRGVGPQGDVLENVIESTDGLGTLSGRYIYGNDVRIPNIVSTITATGNLNANYFNFGGLTRATVTGDVLGNIISIAGPVTSFTVGGAFSSDLTLQGPQTAQLGSLSVVGPIGGTIVSAGKIGRIVSQTGAITADISTTKDAIDGNVDLIQAAGAFLGNLSVSGTLGILSTVGQVGKDPSLAPDYEPTVIDVADNFGQLLIRAPLGGVANLYSNLNVGGDVTTLSIAGGLFGDTVINGNFASVVLQGDIGAQFDLGGPQLVTRGNVEVRGNLGRISMAPGRSILADLVTGGDLASITLVNGSIGTPQDPVLVQSLFGNIAAISVTSGSVYGRILANMSIGGVSVTGGNLGAPAGGGNPAAPVTIQTTHGGIGAIPGARKGGKSKAGGIVVVNGGIFTDGITAGGGGISNISVTGGGIHGTPGAAIRALLSIDALTVSGGNLEVDVAAGKAVGSLAVIGDLRANVSGETGINRVMVTGDVNGATIRSGGAIGVAGTRIKGLPRGGGAITANNILNSTISAATNISSIVALGYVTNTTFMAGYDVGSDLLFNTPDDNPLTGGAARSGSVAAITVAGNWNSSVVAAGVVPVGGSFLAATTPAPGQSSIGALTILGDVTGTSGAVADTSIGPVVTGVPNDPDLARIVLDIPNVVYNGMPQPPTTFWTGNVAGAPLTIRITGPGFFKFDSATGQLALDGTTGASTLRLTTGRGATVPIPIQITGGDDDGLASLVLAPGVTLGNATLDGAVRTAGPAAVAPNSDLNFLGGLAAFRGNTGAAPLNNVDILVGGPLGAFSYGGQFVSGSLTADALPTISNVGNLGANLRATFGGIPGITVRGGTLTGNVMSRDSISSLRITGPAGPARGQYGLAISGDITVSNGDLGALAAYGGVTGSISVPRGGITRLALTGGTFSNVNDPADMNAIRSQTGIGSLAITGGDFAGVLFTDGILGTLSLRTGAINGRLVGLGGITSVAVRGAISPRSGNLESMRNAVLASGSNIGRITLNGDVVDSYIFAGFNPNDDQYDIDHNTDDAWLDAFTLSLDGTIPPDEVWGGTITSAAITGDFIRSAMSAGVGPGTDGYLGNDDDVVAGTGYILRAAVSGRVIGSAGNEAYGFSAATRVGPITVGGQPLGTTGNVVNRPRIDPPGPPHVEAVSVGAERLSIVFDQPIDLSTIRTNWFNGGTPTLNLYISQDRNFDPLTDYNVATDAPHIITYDDTTQKLTLVLLSQTWTSLNQGTNFLLVLDSSVVADASGQLLDGDYLYTFPSGEGEPGGDFIYRFHYGDQGDTDTDALDLLSLNAPDDYASTSDLNVPILTHNQPTSWPGAVRITGEIGDNPALVGQQRPDDVDCFTLDARAGDILYVEIDNTAFMVNVAKFDPAQGDYVLDGPDSLTGAGYYTEAPTTYLIVVANPMGSRAVGSYELVIHLFNDGNSNFPGIGGVAPVGNIGFDNIASLTLSGPYGGTPVANLVGAVDGYSNISAIAMNYYWGELYAVDNGSGRIIEIDPTTGQPTPSASLPVGYTDIHAMDFEAFMSTWVWAVGRNPASQLVLLNMSVLSGTIWAEYPIQPGTVNDISSIVLDPAAPWGNLYGVDPDTNQLVTIETWGLNAGAVTVVGTLWDPATAQPISGVTGITFDDRGALYALAPNMLYEIDPATGQATASYAISLNAPTSLAFDTSGGDLILWSVDASGAEDALVRIDFEPTLYGVENTTNRLLSIDPLTGQGTVVASLPAGYHDVQGLDLNSTLVSDDLWAVGRNPGNALVLMRLDTATAAVLEEHAITPGTITQIGSIAFNSFGVLFGVDTTNNALITIDETTGVATTVGPLLDPAGQPITGITGIEFDNNDTLYAVNQSMMYTIDSTTGQAVLSAPLPAAGLSSLAFGSTLGQARLWSVDASTSPDTLVTISLEGDPTQTPTLLQFVNGVAKPEQVDRDGNLVQVITAVDDVDVYSLGQLAAGTHIDVTLLTRTIGDHTLSEVVLAGVFNSSRELVASLYMPPIPPIGGTLPLATYLDDPIISLNLPATDTYYVAVWGGADPFYVPIDALLPYDLTVRVSAPTPAPLTQAVYLNFAGGSADYLTGYFGPGTDTYLTAFDPKIFGFYGPTDRQTMMAQILTKVGALYTGYSNVSFTTSRPLFGEYSTILIGSNAAPEIGTLGLAEQIDPLNSDLNDMAVVWAGELAHFYHTDFGYTMDDVTTAIANTAAHELGHLLGLNHQIDTSLFPPRLLMSDADPVDPATLGRGPLDSFLIGYQNDAVLLRVIA